MSTDAPGPRSAQKADGKVHALGAGPMSDNDRIRARYAPIYPLASLLCALLLFQPFLLQPFSTDFDIFYQAALTLRQGGNPYQVIGFYSPVYLLAYYLPLTLLPEMLAIRINSVIAIAAIWLAFWRFSRHSIWLTSLGMLSGCVVLSIVNGNNDWMPLLAGLTNPVAGIWLAMTKPQMSIALVAVFIVEHPRSRALWFSLAAIVLLYLASWLMGMRPGDATTQSWNRDVFPMMLPLGVLAAQWAMRKRARALGLAASPLFAPYVGSQSWLVALPWLMQYRVSYIAALIVSWFLIIP